MANKKYSLAIEKLDDAAKEFIASYPDYTFEVKKCDGGKQVQYVVSFGKEKAILNCYISKGLVSHYVDCSKSKKLGELCEKWWEYIVEQTVITAVNQKCFKVEKVSAEDFDTFMEAVAEYNNVEAIPQSTDNNPNIRNQYHLKGRYDAKLSIVYYTNGTLLVQGSLTSFYVEFVTEILQILSSVPNEAIEEVFSMQARSGYIFDSELESHISKMEHIRPIVGSFINTSIALANSAVKVDDYGCYTFGILKALDAVLSERLLEDVPSFDDYGTYFQKGKDAMFHFRNTVGVYDNNEPLKLALERGYTFFNQHRHTTFHIDSVSIESRRTLEDDEAVNKLQECLVIINNICNNW